MAYILYAISGMCVISEITTKMCVSAANKEQTSLLSHLDHRDDLFVKSNAMSIINYSECFPEKHNGSIFGYRRVPIYSAGAGVLTGESQGENLLTCAQVSAVSFSLWLAYSL